MFRHSRPAANTSQQNSLPALKTSALPDVGSLTQKLNLGWARVPTCVELEGSLEVGKTTRSGWKLPKESKLLNVIYWNILEFSEYYPGP